MRGKDPDECGPLATMVQRETTSGADICITDLVAQNELVQRYDVRDRAECLDAGRMHAASLMNFEREQRWLNGMSRLPKDL